MRPDSRITRFVREVILIVEAFVGKTAGELLIPFLLHAAGAERRFEAGLLWGVRAIQNFQRNISATLRGPRGGLLNAGFLRASRSCGNCFRFLTAARSR
jgi:hypothetical protein